MRKPLLAIRVDEATKARWEVAARDSGETLSEFVRLAVEERLSVADGAPAKGKPRKRSKDATQAPTASRTASLGDLSTFRGSDFKD